MRKGLKPFTFARVALDFGERAERHGVDALQDGLLHLHEGRLARRRLGQAQHVVIGRDDVRIRHVVLRVVDAGGRCKELHRGERAEGRLRAVAGEEEVPAAALLLLALHGGRPIDHLELGVDADGLELLGHHQRRIVHAGVVLVGEQDQRLPLVAGLGEVLLREVLVLLVVGFLGDIRVRGAAGNWKPTLSL